MVAWRTSRGFSLLEVVLATAVAAVSLFAVVGLLSPISRDVRAVMDADTGNRLTLNIEREINRIGFSTVRSEILNNAPLYLYADPQGSLVRLGPAPADEPASTDKEVNNSILPTEVLPGIAQRDRHFLIILREVEIAGVGFDTDHSGSINLSATIEWPYRVPDGPASTPDAHGGNARFDASTVTEPTSRESMTLFFAVRP